MGRSVTLAATLAAAGLIVAVDGSPSDDAGQVTLGVILATSLALGWLAGRRGWVVGAILGSTVGLAHLAAIVLGVSQPGASLPPGWPGAASLFVLAIPGALAGWAGSLVRGRPGAGVTTGR